MFILLPIRDWATQCISMRRRRASSSAARKRRSLFFRSETGRRGASPRARGERAAAQRGEDVHFSADEQMLVDAMVHPHAQEENEQQRSEEEMYTLMPSRGRSTGCITMRRRRANSSAGRLQAAVQRGGSLFCRYWRTSIKRWWRESDAETGRPTAKADDEVAQQRAPIIEAETGRPIAKVDDDAAKERATIIEAETGRPAAKVGRRGGAGVSTGGRRRADRESHHD